MLCLELGSLVQHLLRVVAMVVRLVGEGEAAVVRQDLLEVEEGVVVAVA